MTTSATPTPKRATRGSYAKTEARRRQIIEAATVEFATRGYTGGSLREIAKALSLSFTGLMHHFPSKELLLEAVLEHADQLAASEFERRRLADGLLEAILWLAEYNLGHPQLLRLLAVLSAEASSPGHPAHEWFTTRYANLRQSFTAHIREDQAKGLIDTSCNAELAAASIVASWDGTQLQWLIDPSFDMMPAFRHSIRSAVHGVG
ncbi:TetR/AcrR family transcriptional regulator [Arthrobacter sp. alpha11c]